jgi:predicted MPP superfamily phosphohydrolase
MRLHVLRHDVRVPDLDPAHDGLVIAHLTDIHVGAVTPSARIQEAIDHANAATPDLVFLTGDYVCFAKRYVPIMGRALRGLRARTAVIATLGNHDYWTDPEGCARELTQNGYDVLRNQNVELRPRGARLTVIGVDDAVTHHDDQAKAFSGVPKKGTKLVLTHCPETADRAAEEDAHLIVAGHMHGGQVAVKKATDWVARKIAKRRYVGGWYDVGKTPLYVNRGVGSSAMPMRFGEGARPEVALFTLRAA